MQGKFELDCPLIELIPVVSSDEKPTLSGSGFISINENGQFELKVYFPHAFAIDEVFEKLNWEAGKVIKDEFYYNLIAHDISGNVWHAERFIPDKKSGPNGSMIIGKVPELYHKRETTIGSKNHLQLFFNEPINVPLNTIVKEVETVGAKTRKLKTSISLARFDSFGIDFEIELKENYTVLSAESDEVELTDLIINRIFDAFCFVVAYSDPWSSMIIKRNDIIEYKIRAITNKKIKSRIQSPISFQRIQNNNNSVWMLFDKYLAYTAANDVDHNHSISILFYSIMESGKAALDVEALTLSVSIESLLGGELKSLYTLNQRQKNNIKIVSNIISEAEELDSDFKQRMAGLLSSMNSARAKDILFVLRDRGLIDGDLISTYGKLRNKTAHGAPSSGADIQNFFNQTSAVLVLFYQLVFLVIEYEGEYTDYGSYQYPTKQFSSKLS